MSVIHDTFLEIVVGSKYLATFWQNVEVDCTHYTRRDNVYFVLVITILVDSSVVLQYQVIHG